MSVTYEEINKFQDRVRDMVSDIRFVEGQLSMIDALRCAIDFGGDISAFLEDRKHMLTFHKESLVRQLKL